MSSNDNKFTRKKLTPFLAHEMLYDYATGQLDPERRVALEEFLAKDTESQTLLKNIQNALAYTSVMRKVSVDAETMKTLEEAESAVSLGKKYSSWKEWPESLRWSITAIVLSAVTASAVALVPWSKFSSGRRAAGPGPESVEVAQIPQPKPEDAQEVAANDESGSGDEAPDEAGSGDESGDDVADGDESAAPAAAAALAAKPSPTPQPTPVAVAAAKPTPPPTVARETPAAFVSVNFPPKATPSAQAAATPSPGTNASSKLIITQTADTHAPGEARAKGFVYRAFMTLEGLDEIGPKIREDIVSLGGEKAGEVELGWKRGTGRYYHFALPEENEKKILERLQVYGPVRISKDPHPRVMPPGKVRFILWVDSNPDSQSP